MGNDKSNSRLEKIEQQVSLLLGELLKGPGTKSNGWAEWAHHVLTELKRLNAGQVDAGKDITAIQIELGKLKVKAGLWGAIAGALPAIVVAIWYLISHYG